MGRVLTVLVVLVFAAVPARAAAPPDGQEAEEVGRMFGQVWAEEIPPTEKVRLLESVVKDHPDSRWADDALWVLGEAARQEGLSGRMMHYWQYMLSARPDVRLENFTRQLPLYRRSGLPQVEMLLVTEGRSFVRGRPDVVNDGEAPMFLMRNAKRFNAVPMTVWGELAKCYRQRGRLSLALKAYRKALEVAPESGRLRAAYMQEMRDVEARLDATPTPEPEPARENDAAAERSGTVEAADVATAPEPSKHPRVEGAQ